MIETIDAVVADTWASCLDHGDEIHFVWDDMGPMVVVTSPSKRTERRVEVAFLTGTEELIVDHLSRVIVSALAEHRGAP